MNGEKQNGHAEPFVMLPIAVMESEPWRTLPIYARRVLDRIIVEHATHYGQRNGRLVVSYRDFREYGISDRTSIAKGIRILAERGFLEIVEAGRWNGGRGRRAARYRLTFLPTKDHPTTDEWRSRVRKTRPQHGLESLTTAMVCKTRPQRGFSRVRKTRLI
jgi:hypothetical protein